MQLKQLIVTQSFIIPIVGDCCFFQNDLFFIHPSSKNENDTFFEDELED
jgi:hypothetical protein